MEIWKETSNLFDERECANEDCVTIFIPKTYNGVYCSPECRRVVTNKRLLENYYIGKENKKKKRICFTNDCDTVLSIYNKEKICEKCKKERYIARLVSWGWDEKKLRDEM